MYMYCIQVDPVHRHGYRMCKIKINVPTNGTIQKSNLLDRHYTIKHPYKKSIQITIALHIQSINNTVSINMYCHSNLKKLNYKKSNMHQPKIQINTFSLEYFK
jgi:hypothetical protein